MEILIKGNAKEIAELLWTERRLNKTLAGLVSNALDKQISIMANELIEEKVQERHLPASDE